MVVRLLLLSVWCALAFAVAPACAQVAEAPSDLAFQRFGVREGLSNENVFSLIQDRVGFLWIGTRDGLNRYDGHTFRTYRRAEGIPGNEVTALIETRDGRLWIGTERGAAVMDPMRGQIQPVRLPGADGAPVNNIEEDAAGGLWMSTEGRGLFYRPLAGTWRLAALADDPKVNGRISITSLYRGPAGIWVDGVTTPGAGYEPIHSGRLNPERGFVERIPRVYQVAGRDSGGDALFLQDSQRLFRLTHRGGQTEIDPVAALDDWAAPNSSLAQIRPGVWWFGTIEGILEWTAGTTTVRRIRGEPQRRDGLGGYDVRVILRDRRGNVWAGTEAGLYFHRMQALPFRVFQHRPSDARTLSDSRVNAMAADGGGGLWVTTNGGLNRIDLRNGRVERANVRVPMTLPFAFWQVLRTRAGRVLVGAKRGGVFQLTGREGERRLVPYGPFRDAWRRIGSESLEGIRTLVEDRRGRIWAGSKDGLMRLDPDGGSAVFGRAGRDLGLTDTRVNVVYERLDGSLWVGTDAGLFRYDESTETFAAMGVPCAPTVWSMTESAADAGALWIATYGGGLARIAGDRATCVAASDGLPSDLVYGVVPDNDGALWASTAAGLARIELTSGYVGAVTTYNESDGIQGNDHNFMSQLRLPSGELAFGGPNGLTLFDPIALSRQASGAPVAFTGIEVLRQLRASVPLSGDTLRVTHNQNFFTIRFASLDFVSPERHRYLYRLVGVDRTWRETDAASPQAAYTDVPPGTYRFEVVGLTHDGDVESEPAVLTVTVVPAWWQTWAFRIGLGVLLLGIAGALGRRAWVQEREASEARRRESVEVQRRLADGRERERRRLARDLHDGPVQGLYRIGHDLDSLQRASADGASSGDGAPDVSIASQDAAPDVSDVRARVGAVAGELREMLTQLRPTLALHLALPDALDTLATRFSQRFPDIDVSTDYRTEAEGASADARLTLYRIAQEAVENVARHAGADQVTLSLALDGGLLRLRIEDDGRGFDVPVRLVAFAREEHYGLVGMAERAEAVGGRFHVRARAGGGTVVEAFVPFDAVPE